MNYATVIRRLAPAALAAAALVGLTAWGHITAKPPLQLDTATASCAELRELVSENRLAPEAVYDPQAPCQRNGFNRAAGAAYDPWPGPDEVGGSSAPVAPAGPATGPDEMSSSLISGELDYVNGQVTVIFQVNGRTAWASVSRNGWLPYLSGRQHFIGSGR